MLNLTRGYDMDTLKFKIDSVSAMLQHSAKFSNPLDPGAKAHKALTSKRKKTDEDHEAIAKSEYMGSLYWDPTIGVYVPVANFRASLIQGARFNKLGKSVERAVIFMGEKVPLEYDGPTDPDKLFANPDFVDARSVVVQRSRLIRYRPRFNEWSCSLELIFDPSIIEGEDIVTAFENAGALCGVGDYRPLFGRYSVSVV